MCGLPVDDWRARLFTPKVVLILLTIINLLNYTDRYLISGVLDNIESDVTGGLSGLSPCNITISGKITHHDECLTGTQQGLVGSIFMIGFMIGSPIFAILLKWVSSAKLLCLTLLIWCGAVILTGITSNYYILLTARAMSGLGEAAFGCIAPPHINKIAPEPSKGTWLAIYFMATPVGSAFGFGVGGWSSTAGVWRMPFFIEALIMCPLALICFFTPIGRTADKKRARLDAVGEPDQTCWSKLVYHGKLARNPRYMLMCFGYAAFTWTVGGLVYWGIDFITHTKLETDKTAASFKMGAVTALAGLVGTALGGWMLDRWTAGRDVRYEGYLTGSKLNVLFIILAIPPLVAATEVTQVDLFYGMLMIAMTLLLCTTTVSNSALMWCVEEDLQEFAMAMCTVLIHLFGDVPSNVVMGATRSAFGGKEDPRAWRMMFYAGEVGLIPCILLWTLAICFGARAIAKRGPDVARLRIFDDLANTPKESFIDEENEAKRNEGEEPPELAGLVSTNTTRDRKVSGYGPVDTNG